MPISGSLNITAVNPDPALLMLPWRTPLEEWPESALVGLPRGISRHIVRFASLSHSVIAVKETREHFARREYQLLRLLGRLDVPCVSPVAVITGRADAQGNELECALVTEHLKFSLPYRALFSQMLREDTATRLIDALAVLLVRLHLVGFFWGDVSLSNTLFRRDAGAFAAYLVDAETGELYDTLSDGQREHDLEIARVNIAGELFDLQAGELVSEDFDPLPISEQILTRYRSLWAELTEAESFALEDRWRVDARVRRLNDLGFDVGEFAITTDFDGTTVQIQPKVVDAGHHQRRLLRLTGLDAGENQARRLLNDLDSFGAETDQQAADEEIVAHQWLTRVFEPTIRSVPRELTGKLEPAELFHEVLEHRWFMAQAAEHEIGMKQAVESYIDNVLRHRRDEASIIGLETSSIPILARHPEEDW
ncbi:DUF4032 domain-containing protein [Spelaeicoccus albus]|uniref:tRNA A-37 threonylcarbamoyl transferase component Bud32 n=1 Tax=Spelaeicoccus albus TaxID=1280376 RepID=A0A7Z0CZ66_9MICO|nr:DUF4032 domain-containing protein [Spelaeicoccus albus]NYI65964.1 tRNA A-37 threonylcarbamoyl transferase component Bud32 [Spelaeicoccus albus]